MSKNAQDLAAAAAAKLKVDATPADLVGLYGVTPVARAVAITTPTAPGASYVQAEAAAMKTAVDAIRVALTKVGITL